MVDIVHPLAILLLPRLLLLHYHSCRRDHASPKFWLVPRGVMGKECSVM